MSKGRGLARFTMRLDQPLASSQTTSYATSYAAYVCNESGRDATMNRPESGMEPAPRSTAWLRYWPWAVVILAIVLSAAIRLRLLNFPLERDEGEYAYAGQLILQGIPPYKLAYNMKLPGIYFAYAGLMAIFGRSIAGIHLGLIMVNAATIVLVFLLARRLANQRVAAAAAAAYAFLSLSPALLGLAAHATHFVTLAAVGGLLLLLRGLEHDRLVTIFAAGVVLGLAFVLKQQGVFFGIFGGLYLVYRELAVRPVGWRHVLGRAVAYAAGAAIPFSAACVGLWAAGTFKSFWFWTFSYARHYAEILSLNDGLHVFMASFPAYAKPTVLLWLAAAAGVVDLGLNWRKRAHSVFITGLLVFSFLAVCPGFYFRNHYFIVLLPAVGILAGLAVDRAHALVAAAKPQLGWLVAVGFGAIVGLGLFQERAVLFELSPVAACRAVYSANPFPEAVEIARFLRENSSQDAKIAVLGSEPEIYFYSNRRSATGYIYTYALMESQPYALKMQQEMIDEIEAAKPAYVVVVNVPTSWSVPYPNPQNLINKWFGDYSAQHLELAGMIDLLSKDRTEYRWGKDAQGYKPRSPYFLVVLKQKAASG